MSFTHTGLTEQVLSYKPPHPPVNEFEPPKDRAFFADPTKKSLLEAATKVKKLTPYIGTELEGIQLSQLTDAQKDELALLAAERGVVFFRDQDLTIEKQYELTKHYGLQDRDPNQVDPRHVTILGRDEYGVSIYTSTSQKLTFTAIFGHSQTMAPISTPIILSSQIHQHTLCCVSFAHQRPVEIQSGHLKLPCTTSSVHTSKHY